MSLQLNLLVSIVFFYSSAFGQASSTLSGRILNLEKGSIEVVVVKSSVINQKKTLNVPLSGGHFSVSLNLTEPTTVGVFDGVNYVSGIINSRDQIAISYDAKAKDKTLRIGGKGSGKFKLNNDINSIDQNAIIKELKITSKSNPNPIDYWFKYTDSLISIYSRRFESVKDSLDEKEVEMLRGQLESVKIHLRYYASGALFGELPDETLTNREKELTPQAKAYLQQILVFDQTLTISDNYITTVYNLLFMDYGSRIAEDKLPNDLQRKYEYLNSHLVGDLRVPVLTLFLEYDILHLNQGEEIEQTIQKYFQNQTDSSYRNYIVGLSQEYKTFKRGTPAPNFVLENEHGQKISLATFRGKMVFMDFWFGKCTPCHILFQKIKSLKEQYSNRKDVVFLCVSIDDKNVWKAALAKYQIKGYHAYTQDLGVNHPIIKDYKVAGYPTTCIIDKNGNFYSAHPSSEVDELKIEIEGALAVGSK